MKPLKILSGLTALAAAAGAMAIDHMQRVEHLGEVPAGWKVARKADPSRRLHFRIAMKHPQPDILDQTLLSIADPGHARYGKHLGQDELEALTRPERRATEAVIAWLQEAGISKVDIADKGDWIHFRTTLAKAESMLDTSFSIYQNRMTGDERVRTLHYSLPSGLHEYVDLVHPTTRFGHMRGQEARMTTYATQAIEDSATAANCSIMGFHCGEDITPAVLEKLYNINRTGIKFDTSRRSAFANYQRQVPRFADLALFEEKLAPHAKGENFTYELVNGGNFNQSSSAYGEADLDLEYLLAVGYPVKTKAYSTGGTSPFIPDNDIPAGTEDANEPFLEFLEHVLKQPDDKLPHTISTSYGEDEQTWPKPLARKICSMFGQLGARGVSVIFSSGDVGPGSACQTNDGTNRTRVNPSFPGACPYVTSVGATNGTDPEAAIFFSQGGFSDLFPRPAYQDTAVTKYLDTVGNKFKGLYNPHGRAFPDVAAQGFNVITYQNSSFHRGVGTSASAPIFAGVVAMLNSARIAAGKPPLGFLNPWLYAEGYKALNDITVGGSKGCTGSDFFTGEPTPEVPYAGWNATEGWDAVSGLGSPDFGKMLPLAMAVGSYSA